MSEPERSYVLTITAAEASHLTRISVLRAGHPYDHGHLVFALNKALGATAISLTITEEQRRLIPTYYAHKVGRAS